MAPNLSNQTRSTPKLHGVGLGLRWDFIDEVLESETLTDIPFFEIPPENYLRRGGFFLDALQKIRARYPIVTHGLTLSVGGLDPFDDSYLNDLADFLRRLEVPYHSDHLCYSGHDGRVLHDLLPLPISRAAIEHVSGRIAQAQDRLGLPLAVENITHYMIPGQPAMHEAEFIGEILHKSQATMLLDVNNIYVNSLNYGFDPLTFLKQLPLDRVTAIHVAGHERWNHDEVWIDTHGADVTDPVLDLLDWVVCKTGPIPVILERDNNVPSLNDLRIELQRVNVAYERGLARGGHVRP